MKYSYWHMISGVVANTPGCQFMTFGRTSSWYCSDIIVQYFLFGNNMTSVFADVSSYENINNADDMKLQYTDHIVLIDDKIHLSSGNDHDFNIQCIFFCALFLLCFILSFFKKLKVIIR